MYDYQSACQKEHANVSALLEKYRSHTLALKPLLSEEKLAQHILHTKACNSFLSALVLCLNGLHVESFNAIRTALENGWLALLLHKEPGLCREWLLSITSAGQSTEVKSYRKTVGSPQWVRKKLSGSEEEVHQKDTLYSILSIKSHANAASAFFMADTDEGPNQLVFFEPGGINSIQHQCKNLGSIAYCLEYLLWDCQNHGWGGFDVQWQEDMVELFQIAGTGYPDENGKLVVVADKVNDGYQALILLYLAKLQRPDAKSIFDLLKDSPKQ